MKVATIVGARPQFIKAAAVSRAFRNNDLITESIIHTGQHYDAKMSEVFFEELDIPHPEYNLGIGSGSHGAQTGRMLEAIESTLIESQPDWVLVYGDTNSTLAGALAAVKLHLPVAHIEAGLRSFNRRMPEEINRIMTDHASDLLFAPTQSGIDNLRNEGISDEKTHLVGDVMYDAALLHFKQAHQKSGILTQLGVTEGNFILVTLHRAENVDHPRRLAALIKGLSRLSQEHEIVLPLHPRTANTVAQLGLESELRDSVQCIDPVGYLDMLRLESAAKLIATDSGGVQKEAFFARVPCLTLRNETEWVELVDAGWNRLVMEEELAELSSLVPSWIETVNQISPDESMFGGGHAASEIRELLYHSDAVESKQAVGAQH